MFQDSVLEFRAGWRGRSITLASLVAQIGLLAGFIVFPLLHPAALPPLAARAERPTLIVARPLPPKPLTVRVTNSAAISAPAAASVPSAQGPRIARPATETAGDIPVLLPMGNGMATPGPLSATGVASLSAGTASTVTVKPSSGGGTGPLRISSLAAGLLLGPIRPIYPAIARQARVSGTVVVTATIDGQGRIVGAQAISGPLMLRSAATDAVKDARYRPFLLNGKPTEVETTFSVNFVLGS